MSTPMEQEEAVILVVGGEKEIEIKALVADMLAGGRSATHEETTKCGTRVFTRVSAPGQPVVVDTTAMLAYDSWYVEDSASVWSSLNSLRQMHDKLIYVVSVVASSGREDPVHRKHAIWTEESAWLNVLKVIFDEHLREIMVLVKLDGTNHTKNTKPDITDVLSRCGFATNNVNFVTFTRSGLQPTIKSALEDSSAYPVHTAKGRWGGRWGKHKTASTAPFRVKKVTESSQHRDWHGPWGPTPVILLGRTGSGKSTIAQMLTKGRLDPNCKDFVASSSIRGETTQLTAGQGRGWYVVDTPGFGEPDNREAAVSSTEAEKKLTRYVKWIQGRYCHFLYVVMKDRMDQLEENLWKFFMELFGEDISSNFTVVISNADKDWVEENKVHLQRIYKGCKSFLSAEFPFLRTDDAEWESELEEVRKKSLCDLEGELASLLRYSVTCDFGFYSKKNIEAAVASLDLEVHHSGNHLSHEALAFGITGVVKSCVRIRWNWSCQKLRGN